MKDEETCCVTNDKPGEWKVEIMGTVSRVLLWISRVTLKVSRACCKDEATFRTIL